MYRTQTARLTADSELSRQSIQSRSLHRLALGAMAMAAALAGFVLGGSSVSLAATATAPSYQLLVADGGSGIIYADDLSSGTVTPVPDPESGGIQSLVISPDGSRVYVAFKDGTLGTLDTASDSYLGRPIVLGWTSAPVEMVVTPDGQDLYIAESGSNQVVEVDAATGAQVGTPISSGPVLNMAISHDGSSIFIDGGDQSSSVGVISTATNTVSLTPIQLTPLSSPIAPNTTTPIGAGAMAMSPSGTSLYVVTSDSAGPAVAEIDPATAAVVGALVALPATSQPTGLAVSADGSEFYLTDSSGPQVDSISTAIGALNPTVDALPQGVSPQGIALTPDGTFAYVDGTDSAGASLVVPVDLATGSVGAPTSLVGGTAPAGLVIAPLAATVMPTPSPTPSPSCSPIIGIGPVQVGPAQFPPSAPTAGATSGSAPASSPAASPSSGRPGSNVPLPANSPVPESSPGTSPTPTPVICFGTPILPPGTFHAEASLASGTAAAPSGSLYLRLALVIVVLTGSAMLAVWRFGLNLPRLRNWRNG
ncbi:MAG: YncE family protein [Candidatus Dormiibacterota bacterium]